jgi:putative cardiolipin synthase
MTSCRSLPALLLLALLAGCAAAPRHMPPKTVAQRPDCSAATPAALLAERLSQSPDSGVHLLDTGAEAFAARAAMIEAAGCAIDAQYYIWNSDASGRYLAGRLIAAADRGVRVRLLLDDINVGDREGVLAALAAHPNVEVQIYNPFAQRRGLRKLFDFLSDFARLNRRMHVKSFTVDQAFSVVGGRNIGDEYFDAGENLNFRDRDVLVSGPAVREISAMFEQFWASPLARPVGEVAAGSPYPAMDLVAQRMAAAGERIADLHDNLPADQAAGIETLEGMARQMLWVPARLIFDPPPDPTSVGDVDLPQPGAAALRRIAQDVSSEVLIASAYLVLDDDALAQVAQMSAHGVRFRALTNSLASNDVTANHAAYARRRTQMLASGIELHELRPDAPSCGQIIQNASACGAQHVFGLHAKTYVLDRRLVYVGSLNLNLRSRYLNAEAGLLIESSVLAERIAGDIEVNMQPANSWQPAIDADGRLKWIGNGWNDQGKQYATEPAVGWLRRMRSGFIALFPLEKYL